MSCNAFISANESNGKAGCFIASILQWCPAHFKMSVLKRPLNEDDHAPPPRHAKHDHDTTDRDRGGRWSVAADLPIAAHKAQLVSAVHENQVVIVLGETGCGKTTQLPQFLTDAAELQTQQSIVRVAVTQPRRVAAISVARRVAQERGCRLGTQVRPSLQYKAVSYVFFTQVGYTIRFDDTSSDETAIKYMTDGVLVRECMEDRTLARYDVVILDEAHERSLETDVLFGLLKLAVQQRKELRVGYHVLFIFNFFFWGGQGRDHVGNAGCVQVFQVLFRCARVLDPWPSV